jgi:hypothetical protein
LATISYNPLVKIYTRTGDTGETSLFSGDRARKDDPRVDAYGEIDELNAWLGLVRASSVDPALDPTLVGLQRDLFALGAQLADPADKLAPRVSKAVIDDEHISRPPPPPPPRCTSPAPSAAAPSAGLSRSIRLSRRCCCDTSTASRICSSSSPAPPTTAAG